MLQNELTPAKTLYNPWLPGIISILIGLILGLRCLTPLSTIFRYIVEVSFIGGMFFAYLFGMVLYKVS